MSPTEVPVLSESQSVVFLSVLLLKIFVKLIHVMASWVLK